MTRALLPLLLIAAPSLALAQTADDRWSERVTLYGWMSASDVNATATTPGGGRLSGSGSASIVDTLDAANFAFFANAELRRGRWGLIGDIVYADLNFHGPNALGGRDDLDMSSFLGTAAVSWRAWQGGGAWIDLMGGARLVASEVTISRAGPGVSQRAVASDAWVDPVIGLRGRYALGERTALFGLFDIGGFGVGSELSWQAIAGVEHDLTERVAVEFAFRYLSMDYESGPVRQKLEMYGPLLGLSLRF